MQKSDKSHRYIIEQKKSDTKSIIVQFHFFKAQKEPKLKCGNQEGFQDVIMFFS